MRLHASALDVQVNWVGLEGPEWVSCSVARTTDWGGGWSGCPHFTEVGVPISHPFHIPLLVLGNLEIRNLATGVVDISPLSERLGRDLDGILGHSLLEGRIVRI